MGFDFVFSLSIHFSKQSTPYTFILRSFICPCAGAVVCPLFVVRWCWLWLIAFNCCCCFGACGLFLWVYVYCVGLVRCVACWCLFALIQIKSNLWAYSFVIQIYSKQVFCWVCLVQTCSKFLLNYYSLFVLSLVCVVFHVLLIQQT